MKTKVHLDRRTERAMRTPFDRSLYALVVAVDGSWWGSPLRARTPDGDRLDVKEARLMRAIRLFFRITGGPSGRLS